jgi:hypothetical protein
MPTIIFELFLNIILFIFFYNIMSGLLCAVFFFKKKFYMYVIFKQTAATCLIYRYNVCYYYYYYYPPYSASPGYWRLAGQNPHGEKTTTDLCVSTFQVSGVCSGPLIGAV